MTPDKFLKIRTDLGISQTILGNWINPKAKDMRRDIRRWEKGHRTIPGYIDVMMCMFEVGCRPVHIVEESK